MSVYTSTRITEALLKYIDEAIEKATDSFGTPLYKSRTEFVDDAVKRRLTELGIVLEASQ
jgi:metal-responsive CopG/Arc/MetJ family transcriptional regulator